MQKSQDESCVEAIEKVDDPRRPQRFADALVGDAKPRARPPPLGDSRELQGGVSHQGIGPIDDGSNGARRRKDVGRTKVHVQERRAVAAELQDAFDAVGVRARE